MAEADALCEGFLYDSPLACERGYRVYLPARAKMAQFEEILDLLTEYKYNRIMLEIGGAMEYKRHPEISATWAAFCREMRSTSGKTFEIQHKTYPWPKNSIHCDNAEGDVLTWEECRRIAALCRERGIEVIPECPTLSHCDYIVMAHPEIREREGDEYPDTYCPNHPDTYPLVFDILDEVIEVFCPKEINIGHDEAYSISICKRCRKTPAPVNYANDIKKIKAYLDERGIKTAMWGGETPQCPLR
jgi:hexosaminidase